MKYSFSAEFQEGVLALLLRDPTFALDYRDALNPSHWSDANCGTLARLALEYVDSYGRVPSLEVLLTELRSFGRRYHLDKEEIQELDEQARRILELPAQDDEYIKGKALEFAQHQALKLSLREAAERVRDIEQGNGPQGEEAYDQLRDTLQRALLVGVAGVRDLGFEMRGGFSQIPKLVKGAYLKGARTIPTGLAGLDAIMKGGLGRGEVGVLFGPPKRGKSSVLVNFGAVAARRGFTVVHYTFELKREDVILRYACRGSGMTDQQLLSMTEASQVAEYLGRMQTWFQGDRSNVIVVYERPGTVGADWIRAHLSRLQAVRGIKPDLVIVDFMDRLKRSHADNLYLSGGDAMEKFVGIGDDFDCAVWTASQGSRASASKRRVDASDVGESWRKIADCDVSISLNQDGEQKLAGELDLFVTGQRRGPDTRWVHCKIDYARCTVKEVKYDSDKPDSGSNGARRPGKRRNGQKRRAEESLGSYLGDH